MKTSQNGNVLFLILIAVALFAALSYAVTVSTRSGGGNSSKESASVSAGRILSFETAIRSAITRLTVSNGVTVYDLKFDNDIYKKRDGTLGFTSMGTPTDPSLYIFHPQGGGVSPQIFVDISVPCSACSTGVTESGHIATHWVNIPGVGTSTADGAVRIIGLKQETCLALNEKNGISFIPALTTFNSSAFTGSTPPARTPPVGQSAADDDAINGQMSFCYIETGTGRYNYSFVIKAN